MNILQVASELDIRTPDADVFNAVRMWQNQKLEFL